ncbi:unnamed protein product [Pleuronectes platessa]|uniref:Uncharacterized protein n=1 Tax=Pleuronectes platessa TaxID=8262 RepID=A0A9N7TRC0_PLEPL|nr:unnamed protein product [Pleuronectes platessa]
MSRLHNPSLCARGPASHDITRLPPSLTEGHCAPHMTPTNTLHTSSSAHISSHSTTSSIRCILTTKRLKTMSPVSRPTVSCPRMTGRRDALLLPVNASFDGEQGPTSSSAS